MRMRTPILVGIVLMLVFSPMGVRTASAQGAEHTCVFVSETGHNIHGAFWEFYWSHNGLENFGLPLTEAFLEKGILVQYFERAKFEFHPEYPAPYRVQVALLGLQYGITDPPLSSNQLPPPDNPNFLYFPATGQVISFAVKKYYESHGGWELLGYPVSFVRFEHGSFFQYFQRARLEWNLLTNTVRASPVGRDALEKNYPTDFQWRLPTANDWCQVFGQPPVRTVTPAPTPTRSVFFPTPIPAKAALSLQVYVRFRQPGPKGPQYVDVTVYDQNLNPLPGVAFIATVQFANSTKAFPLMTSNASGRSALSFEIGNQPLTWITIVEVTAYSGTLTARGRDYFPR